MGQFFPRLFVIMIAYAMATLGAYAILMVKLMLLVGLQEPGATLGYVLSVSFLLALLGASTPPLIILVLPAIAILIAEYVSLRSWIYYAGMGTLTGFIVVFTLEAERATNAHSGHFGINAALSVIAGITGGLIYWRIAGRNAGMDNNETSETDKTGESAK